jgi:phosphatidylethanolamine/phosphatidyl-N-methylethanolamine N-methyltransferase
MSSLRFLKNFLADPRTIGAIAPSSGALAESMLKPIDFASDKVLVEYGPGTGAFTQHLLSRVTDATFIMAIERCKDMYDLMRQKHPRLLIRHGSAANVGQYLAQLGYDHADAVISGLPWAAFPESLQDEILEATVAALPPGGRFSTFAYLQGLLMPSGKRFRRKLNQRFSKVEISPVVWMNLPPAIVYWCTK